MFKNIRYLYHMLGTADISTLGEGANIGTVTGAISKLNSDILGIYRHTQAIRHHCTISLDSFYKVKILFNEKFRFIPSVVLSYSVGVNSAALVSEIYEVTEDYVIIQAFVSSSLGGNGDYSGYMHIIACESKES